MIGSGAVFAPRMEAITMPCKHCYDDYCTRHDCPYCAEWCPVMEHPEACKYYEDGGIDDD